jgi:lipopolysaccharide/colanic/teichoic acid biosynthesis glycosyltransferase
MLSKWLSKHRDRPSLRSNMIFLRICDISISLGALIVLALPMALIALIIWLEDRNQIIFTQIRVGKLNRKFKIFKFRTMIYDSKRYQGDDIGSLAKDNLRARFETTAKNDVRITKVGKYIRPIHLDELPQLINVIFGHMSLVGVRPDVPIQELDYPPQIWSQRHYLRPGITGLAQINSDIENMEERMQLDLFWVNNASVILYFKILLKTFLKVLRRNSI